MATDEITDRVQVPDALGTVIYKARISFSALQERKKILCENTYPRN
jgi:hypothetical protein